MIKNCVICGREFTTSPERGRTPDTCGCIECKKEFKRSYWREYQRRKREGDGPGGMTACSCCGVNFMAESKTIKRCPECRKKSRFKKPAPVEPKKIRAQIFNLDDRLREMAKEGLTPADYAADQKKRTLETVSKIDINIIRRPCK